MFKRDFYPKKLVCSSITCTREFLRISPLDFLANIDSLDWQLTLNGFLKAICAPFASFDIESMMIAGLCNKTNLKLSTKAVIGEYNNQRDWDGVLFYPYHDEGGIWP